MVESYAQHVQFLDLNPRRLLGEIELAVSWLIHFTILSAF